jgi:hypothetical protein
MLFLSNILRDLDFQDTYLCRSMAAYAFECAKKNSPIAWIASDLFKTACVNSNYGVCTGGQVFQDCARGCLKTCRDLSNKNINELCDNECSQGNCCYYYLF